MGNNYEVCPNCAGELITEVRCDGRCEKVWKIEELRKLLGDEDVTEDPGDCLTCGASFQWVRPGKSQATCECWSICSIHGKGAISYHPEGIVQNISGYFCVQCWLELDKELKR